VALADLSFTEIARYVADSPQILCKSITMCEGLLANVVGERFEIVAHHRNWLVGGVNRVVSDPVARALVADPLGMG
jgi:hypothetical protein